LLTSKTNPPFVSTLYEFPLLLRPNAACAVLPRPNHIARTDAVHDHMTRPDANVNCRLGLWESQGRMRGLNCSAARIYPLPCLLLSRVKPPHQFWTAHLANGIEQGVSNFGLPIWRVMGGAPLYFSVHPVLGDAVICAEGRRRKRIRKFQSAVPDVCASYLPSCHAAGLVSVPRTGLYG